MLRTIVVTIGLLSLSAAVHAKLPHFPLDYYVRHAELIVVGKVARTDDSVVTFRVDETLMGTAEDTVSLISPPKNMEDGESYREGESALLFLRPVVERPNAFVSVQAMAGKVTFTGDAVESLFFPAYTRGQFISLVRQFAGVKKSLSRDEQVDLLVAMLDSADLFVLDSATGYLEYLINGAEDREWSIKPPKNSDWNYREYYRLNVLADRNRWQEWRKARR